MKTCYNHVRDFVCTELLRYRAQYKMYCNLTVINDDILVNMYHHYIMLRGYYYAGLISTDTATRVYYMLAQIRRKGGYYKCQSVIN